METMIQPETERLSFDCPERPEVAREAFAQLKCGMENLGFSSWELPDVSIVFQDSAENNELLLGRVRVKGDNVCIVYDKSFATQDGEHRLTSALLARGIEYPGMIQTLAHELSHIAMWSVTGMDRQPAIRLLDEGWATLIAKSGSEERFDIKKLAGQVKGRIMRGLQEEPDIYRRCLDLSNPVADPEGGLNEAEYNVGAALLLWIARGKGPKAMIDLLRKSPQAAKHNDERMEPAELDSAVHALTDEHAFLVQRANKIDGTALAGEARKWEVKQFHVALLEISNYSTVQDAQKAFEEWLRE